jgi:crossover junction endodeoxyribonuclease RuvC
MRVLGIDPGLTGAIALLDLSVSRGEITLRIEDMPILKTGSRGRSRNQVVEQGLANLVRDMKPEQAFLEQVHSMPRQGVASTFTFGLSYGIVRGVLAGLNIPITLLTPQKWGALVQLPRGDDASRVRASQLFPAEAGRFVAKSAHGRSDAALIALAGVRTISPF